MWNRWWRSFGYRQTHNLHYKIIILFFWEFLTPALADGFTLESKGQQVSSSLQDSSWYSGRSQQSCILDGLHWLSYFQVLKSLYQSFGDCTEHTNYNWHHRHFHSSIVFCFIIIITLSGFMFSFIFSLYIVIIIINITTMKVYFTLYPSATNMWLILSISFPFSSSFQPTRIQIKTRSSQFTNDGPRGSVRILRFLSQHFRLSFVLGCLTTLPHPSPDHSPIDQPGQPNEGHWSFIILFNGLMNLFLLIFWTFPSICQSGTDLHLLK